MRIPRSVHLISYSFGLVPFSVDQWHLGRTWCLRHLFSKVGGLEMGSEKTQLFWVVDFGKGNLKKTGFRAPPVEIYGKSWCISCDGGWLILTLVICRVCWFVHGFHIIFDCDWADVVWFGHPANQLRFVVNPKIKSGLYIPGGAGFLPSTVSTFKMRWFAHN